MDNFEDIDILVEYNGVKESVTDENEHTILL